MVILPVAMWMTMAKLGTDSTMLGGREILAIPSSMDGVISSGTSCQGLWKS